MQQKVKVLRGAMRFSARPYDDVRSVIPAHRINRRFYFA